MNPAAKGDKPRLDTTDGSVAPWSRALRELVILVLAL
jgi:hypothetical protein